MSSLMDRLMAKRHQRFVGRSAEIAMFQAAIDAEALPFFFLYIFAPGGFGKTTLLNEYFRLCRDAGLRAVMIDARNFEPAPDAFQAALRMALDVPPAQLVSDFLEQHTQRNILMVDTFELLVPIEGWLRDTFLPRLPDTVLTVAAGRFPLATAWRTDPGWQDLIHTLTLHNLTATESADYLMRRGIPTEHHTAILDHTYGHPLALSLVADTYAQQETLTLKPERMTDIIHILTERFVKGVPSQQHRLALEASAMVRLMNEALLETMLEVSDAFEIFDWLRNLSFVEIGESGLYLHDLTRDAIISDLRWRNREGYNKLHQRARNYYFSKLRPKQDPEQARLLYDLVYLHRDNPAVRPAFDWQLRGNLVISELLDSDVEALLAMVVQHEGEDSGRLAAHWMSQQPGGVRVLRGPDATPVGFIMTLALNRLERPEVDPGVYAAWQFVQSEVRLRPGETALMFRFWMGRDSYQAVSPEQTNCFIIAVQYYLTTPGLAFTLLPCADPDFWLPVFGYANLPRLPQIDFEVGGKRYGVYGHDWRAEPPSVWLDMLAAREVGSEHGQAATPPPRHLEPTIVLTREEFEAAVQDAMKSLLRPDELGDSPLLRSRLVVQRTNSSATEKQLVTTLQDLIREAAEVLKQHPRDGKFYQAIHYTYLHPAPTQEQAAELLDLPFSTFRRHLKNGITRIADILWQEEVGGQAVE
jgi:hypothetical protein